MSQDNNNSMKKAERLKSVLDNNTTLPDCVFIIDGEEIKAHKAILTCHSLVFEKMFYGELASNRIVITDINLCDFRQMLEFIYSKKVAIESVLQAWNLYYIAHKYLLNEFADACTGYIEKNLAINNLLLNYEYAEMYGIDHLQATCIRDISINIRGIFPKYCDYHMKPSSLVKILQQSSLNISSNDLIEGVLHWAVIECDIKRIHPNPENLVNILKSSKILQFLINLEFKIDLNCSDLIKKACQLIKNLKNPNMLKIYSKKHWCTFCYSRQIYKIAGRVELREKDYLISSISVNRYTLLYGLVVVTEDKQFGAKSNEYNGTVSIEIGELNRPESVSITKYSSSLPYETLIYVPLSELIFMECDKIYSIKIGYTNFDNFNDLGIKKSSILCNYMSNKLIDEKRKIIFSFDELNGGVVKGICYYPV